MKNLKMKFLALPALLFGASAAMAAVDPVITTALSDMKADGLVVAGAVLVAIIAIAAFKILRKAV